ncbi:PEP-CTERM sorting domain-containing protein [Paucibacter sp. B2R-40]|uniref:PEP-CTERM sorting domain-containing protein n=1 Tax=Paucibacter sp. B2R-40 TaxID=2893554 RepID=UPI0021E484A6|nr:PEP-CTERM sorting domain-containing protein [Paucibacter sp. B2R-40]MCV2355283.1 PEP-CTERM sorting domain-containing protein [Paucibacter sp. B2R-40]
MQTQLRTLATAVALTLSAATAFAAPALLTVGSADFSSATSGLGWGNNAWATAAASFQNGQLLLSGTNENAATRKLNNSISSAVRVEFDLSFSGVLSSNDFAALWFGNSNGPNIGLKANCGGNCSNDLFVRGSGSAGSFANNFDISNNTVYHLMGLLEKTGKSANYDSFKLWVNPSETERVQLTGADTFSNLTSNLSSFDKIGFRTANLTGNDRVSIDNLNISVVPEPASLALTGLGLALLAFTKRRRVG